MHIIWYSIVPCIVSINFAEMDGERWVRGGMAPVSFNQKPKNPKAREAREARKTLEKKQTNAENFRKGNLCFGLVRLRVSSGSGSVLGISIGFNADCSMGTVFCGMLFVFDN